MAANAWARNDGRVVSSIHCPGLLDDWNGQVAGGQVSLALT